MYWSHGPVATKIYWSLSLELLWDLEFRPRRDRNKEKAIPVARLLLLSGCNRRGQRRVYSGSPRHCGEVVFGFVVIGFDEQPVLRAGFEGIGSDALEGRVHPRYRRSVRKFFCRH